MKFRHMVFEEKLKVIQDVVENLPIASRLRNSSQETSSLATFNNFKKSVYKPFVAEIADEIEAKIIIDPVSSALKCLDVKYFPTVKSALPKFGLEDLDTLTEHFGEAREEMHPKTKRLNRSAPKISRNDAVAEYEVFKTVVFDLNVQRNIQLKEQIILKQAEQYSQESL